MMCGNSMGHWKMIFSTKGHRAFKSSVIQLSTSYFSKQKKLKDMSNVKFVNFGYVHF